MAAAVALEEEDHGGVKQQGEQHQCQEINEVSEETQVPVCWTASESHVRRRVAASAFIYFYLLQNSRGTKFTTHGNFFFKKCPNKINKIPHNKVIKKKKS